MNRSPAERNPSDAFAGNNPESWWRSRARHLALKVNIAWSLESLAAPLVLASTAASAAIIIWRTHGSTGDSVGTLTFCVATIATLLVALSLWRARRKFESPDQSLVRMETALGLHNALSTAQAGITPWPDPIQTSITQKAGLNWQWRKLALPPIIALATIAAALWIPINIGSATASTPPRQPLAWSQLDADLDALMESAVIEETYIEETRKRIKELRARDPSEWFSHHSMEATDAITQAHLSETNRLEEALSRAEQAVERMAVANPDERLHQFKEYQNALEDMAHGAMRPNESLREQLAEIGPENFNQLSREQLDQLRQHLRDANDALGDALPNGDGEAADHDDPALMPGGGNPGEDGEHVPGVLGERRDHEIQAGEFTPLAALDLSRAGLGDLLEIQSSPHDPTDTTPRAPSLGGESEATGRGGERVWRDALDPAEQRTLRRFFE